MTVHLQEDVIMNSHRKSFRTLSLMTIGALGIISATGCAAEVTSDESASDVASAASALVSDGYSWGFVRVQPGFPVDPLTSQNSGRGTNSYTGANGDYIVTMNELGVSGGTVQVMATGTAAVRCKVLNFGIVGAAQRINVKCHNTAGALTSTPFVVFFNKGSRYQRGAYVFYDGFAVSPTRSWNSTAASNSVTNTAVGRYRVELPGLMTSLFRAPLDVTPRDLAPVTPGPIDPGPLAPGLLVGATFDRFAAVAAANASVHVTSHGASSSYCKIESWGGGSVNVRCNDNAGNPVNSAFVLNYSAGALRSGLVGGHAWVDAATSASAAYQSMQPWLSCGTRSPVTVSGFNTVRFPGTRYDAMATQIGLVTAYGDDANFCNATSVLPDGDGFVLRARCFTPSGAVVVGKFTTTLTVGGEPGPC
jgi:hypothetical protein